MKTLIQRLRIGICLCGLLLQSSAFSADSQIQPTTWRSACRSDADRSKFQTSEGGCQETETRVVWGMSPKKDFSYEDALAFCRRQYQEGFYEDWNLPSESALRRIAELEARKSFAPQNDLNFWFWSRDTTEAATQSNRLRKIKAICPATGEAFDFDETARLRVICNRLGTTSDYGCKQPGFFFITSFGGCLDLRTGLVWSRPSRDALSVEDATLYCKAPAGVPYADWRFPSSDELAFLSRTPSAGNQLVLSQDNAFYWTSTHRTKQEHYVVNNGQPRTVQRDFTETRYVRRTVASRGYSSRDGFDGAVDFIKRSTGESTPYRSVPSAVEVTVPEQYVVRRDVANPAFKEWTETRTLQGRVVVSFSSANREELRDAVRDEYDPGNQRYHAFCVRESGISQRMDPNSRERSTPVKKPAPRFRD